MADRARAFAPLFGTTSVLCLVAGLAQGAALEQVVPNTIRLLYQEGSYAELGVTYTDPSQSGDGANLAAIGIPLTYPGNTGDIFESSWQVSGAWKADINDRLSYAILLDQPLAANTDYGAGSFPGGVPPAGFSYQGSYADLATYQISAVLAYDVRPDVKLFGGLRGQRLKASAGIPLFQGYDVDADAKWGFGFLAGAAYERPDVALRVALTYFSRISYELDTAESTTAGGTTDTQNTQTDVDTPQSVSLDFQTGVAPDTLIFGSIRWVDWSEFAIEPPVYAALTQAITGAPRPLVEYADDWWTYSLGMGHQFTETLAGSLSVTYEPDVGGVMTTLGPYDGRTLATAALSYDRGKVNLTGGVTYGRLGDTTNLLATDFNDGSVWGAGLRVGYSF